ncbi:hypothetical protein MBLNU230_g2152t1 [Neophaeotheca triangularis]
MAAPRRTHSHAHHSIPATAGREQQLEAPGFSSTTNDTAAVFQQSPISMENKGDTFATSLADRVKGRRRGATKTPDKESVQHPLISTFTTSWQRPKTDTGQFRKRVKHPTPVENTKAAVQPPQKPNTQKKPNRRRSAGQDKQHSPMNTSPVEVVEGRDTSPATSEASTIINPDVAQHFGLSIDRHHGKRTASDISLSTNAAPPPKRARLDSMLPSEQFPAAEDETQNTEQEELSEPASSPLSELADEEFAELEEAELARSEETLASEDMARNTLERHSFSILAALGQPSRPSNTTDYVSPDFSPLTPAVGFFTDPPASSTPVAQDALNSGPTPSFEGPLPSDAAIRDSVAALCAPTSPEVATGTEFELRGHSKRIFELRRKEEIENWKPGSMAGHSEVSIRPYHDVEGDTTFRDKVIGELEPQAVSEVSDVQRRQARRILELLQVARPPAEGEASFLSGPEASDRLHPGVFDDFPIFTESQQPSRLQSISDFLDEFYDDDARVSIQDPAAYETDTDEGAKRATKHASKKKKVHAVREVAVRELKKRFASPLSDGKPWNCLELATPADDGYRPQFLSTEDCRLLTKLKIPGDGKKTSRRDYHDGYKEVEKWALLGQAALTEPHQDSHGYSTYITVNEGLVGFGWLSNPTEHERAEWADDPAGFVGGRWRFVIVKPGQTVYFPAGTVHFVFRMPSGGNTLSFGGHVLRCSNLVHWMKVLRAEKENRFITNEDMGLQLVRNYLARVERFVKQGEKQGKLDKWGGEVAVQEFLALKKGFIKR